MKLIKPFYGVPNGAIYPVHYQKGEDCPPELEEAAREAGCLKDGRKPKPDTPPPAPPEPPANEDDPPASGDDGGEPPEGAGE